eukprot:11159950-Ditylum_brightwellii.AAC.1
MVMHCAVTALRIRVVAHYGDYHLATQTFGKNNKTTSRKEATEEKTGLCPAWQEIKKNTLLPTLFKS